MIVIKFSKKYHFVKENMFIKFFYVWKELKQRVRMFHGIAHRTIFFVAIGTGHIHNLSQGSDIIGLLKLGISYACNYGNHDVMHIAHCSSWQAPAGLHQRP